MPPFDTRLSLGTSNQEEKLKIFFMIQGLSDQELTTALRLF
ncbi:accessory Sec system glycosyltransferase Asp1 [Limosilactobacillus fermentum]